MPARGQSLVLMSLVVLQLAVAAVVVLGISHQVQRKLALDDAADAAAYSHAVATARTLNSIALLNRSQAATMVAMSGAQAALSYGATWHGLLEATRVAYYRQWTAEYCGGRDGAPVMFTGCAGAGNTQTFIDLESYDGCLNARARPMTSACIGPRCEERAAFSHRNESLLLGVPAVAWSRLDRLAGEQVLAIHREAVRFGAMQRAALAALRQTRFDRALQPAGARYDHLHLASELDRLIAPGDVMAGLSAALGSREHPFITRRADGRRVLQEQLDRVLARAGAAGEAVISEPLLGNSWFGRRFDHGATAREWAALSEEHSLVTVNFRGSSGASSEAFNGWVGSTDLQDRADNHSFCPQQLQGDERRAPDEHTLLPHQTVPEDTCPGASCIWPDFVDVDPAVLADAADAFGQPKSQVLASLPPDARRPWELTFRFTFSPSGGGVPIDVGRTRDLSGAGVVLPRAASTAITYYHRPDHWREPPNLFNPFWRATLASADVDDAHLDELRAGLGRTSPWAGASLEKLLAAGFRGLP